MLVNLPLSLQKCLTAPITGNLHPVTNEESFQGFYSKLFSVFKPHGDVLPILHLKTQLVPTVEKKARFVIAFLLAGDFLLSVDNKDTCLHIAIFSSSRTILLFEPGRLFWGKVSFTPDQCNSIFRKNGTSRLCIWSDLEGQTLSGMVGFRTWGYNQGNIFPFWCEKFLWWILACQAGKEAYMPS